MTRYAGGTPVPSAPAEDKDFRFDPRRAARAGHPAHQDDHPQLASQSDGGLLTREDLEAIAHIAKDHDITVMADEIYGRLVYDGEQVSDRVSTGMAERTIVLDGFSKSVCHDRWRMGYAIVPPSLCRRVQQADHQQRLGTSAFQQVAAPQALNGRRIRSMRWPPSSAPAGPGRRGPESNSRACVAGCHRAPSTPSPTSAAPA
jgi:aspartate/methionine/tyrosine aminotransferase